MALYKAPFGLHNGPSINVNPPATFSIVASFGTSASSPGSSLTILPTALLGADSDALGVLEHPTRSKPRATANGSAGFRRDVVICIMRKIVFV
jgi:hypothetical protein